jgi:hypothetical protein
VAVEVDDLVRITERGGVGDDCAAVSTAFDLVVE